MNFEVKSNRFELSEKQDSSMMKPDKDIQREIEEFYTQYNYKESWKLLNCPKKNLRVNNGIMIVTLNPGSRKGIDYTNQVKFSTEVGFSFQAEAAKSNVQPQIKKFLTDIYSRFHTPIPLDEFVNAALVGYFIPIRSNNFKTLNNKKELINFGKEIWIQIVKQNLDSLKLLVVIDRITMKAVLELFTIIGLQEIDSFSLLTGWGKYKADIMRFKFNNKIITLLRVPHLGRFQIFGRSVSKNQVDKIVEESVKFYSSNKTG